MFLYGDKGHEGRFEGHCKYRMKESILLDNCNCIVAMTLDHNVFDWILNQATYENQRNIYHALA